MDDDRNIKRGDDTIKAYLPLVVHICGLLVIGAIAITRLNYVEETVREIRAEQIKRTANVYVVKEVLRVQTDHENRIRNLEKIQK